MSTQIEEQTEVEPGRNLNIEQELSEKYHVDFKFLTDVKASQFDMAKALHNQARFDPIDQTTVNLYTESVRRGDKFPAVLAYRPQARHRYMIIDGNHRLAAHAAADVPMDLYEIDRDTDPRTIALLTFALNTRHGKPTSEDERVHQAIYLIDGGAGIEQAAAAVNIPAKVVKKAMARSKADQRADEVSLRRNEWDTLSTTVKTRLLNISTDEGFRAAANLAYQAKLDAPETTELVVLLNGNKSAKRQEAIVQAHRDMHQDRIQAGAGGVLQTAARRRTMAPKARTSMALAQVLALPEDDQAIVKSYATPEREPAAQRMREASSRLIRLADLLAPLKKR